jgi:DNA polymerase III epsilon subunit-like protein
MSSKPALYLLHTSTLNREKCSWRREYFKLTLTGKLTSVGETEDKIFLFTRYPKLWLPAGCVLTTRTEYAAALLRFRKADAVRKRLAELEKAQRKQADKKLAGIRGLGPAPRPAAPVLTVATTPEEAPAAGLFDDFTIVDTEYQGDYLLEVAAVRYKNWVEVDRYESFVRFTDWIWPVITQTTGITARDVAKATPEKEVLQKFIDLAEGSLLIAHNIGADRSKFEKACMRQGRPMLANKWFCTLALARARLPKDTKCGLTDLCDRFKFSNKDAHRAMSDVGRTYKVLRHFYLEDPITSLDPKARKAAPTLFAA